MSYIISNAYVPFCENGAAPNGNTALAHWIGEVETKVG